MKKKYELVEDDFIMYKGRKLYRIKALRTFSGSVSKGDLGGYVEGYHNLSQKGDCWIFNDAKVYDNARVKDEARVGGGAEVYENAEVESYATILDNSEVFGNARVKGFAYILSKSKIYDNAVIKGGSRVCEMSQVFGNARIESTVVDNVSTIYNNAVLILMGPEPLSNVTFCDNNSVVSVAYV